jgi:alginate O-acetyltransferase complex protein AlgI
MWLMALAIFCGCKWLTWRRALRTNQKASVRRSVAYLFAWPGMNAVAFLNQNATVTYMGGNFGGALWVGGFSNVLAGGLLIWAARNVLTLVPEMAGWMTMVGIVLILHFGSFKLLNLFWQGCGVNALPIMCQPFKASSLREFWSRRWNTAFTGLVHDLALRPLVRRFGINGAILSVFLISGLVHEAVISLPAQDGFGLPTGYFLLQALGIILARQASRWGLNEGIRGRIYAALFTIGPVYWLFHPPFIHNVILPMLGNPGTLN